MSDSWSYLPGTGDAWERMYGSTGDAYNRLPGTTGDTWTRLTASTGGDVYVDTDLLSAITAALAPWIEHQTIVEPETLVAEMLLKAYSEIQLGSGAIITLGFINGLDVRLLPSEPPWAPETDTDGSGPEVGIQLDLGLFEDETIPFSPVIETGPHVATLEVGSTQYSVAVYGDAIYSWALNMATTPLYPSVDTRTSLDVDVSVLESKGSILTPSPYALLYNEVASLGSESVPLDPVVDTDCAVTQQVISSESYGFMCLVQEGCGVDLTTLSSKSIIEAVTIEIS